MLDIFSELNWVGIVVGAVLAYALGALWYSSRLFGVMWMAAQPHRKPEDYSQAALGMVLMVFTALSLSVLVGYVIEMSALLTPGGEEFFFGVLFVSVVWGLSMAGTSVFGGESREKFMIDAGYKLASIVLMGLAYILL